MTEQELSELKSKYINDGYESALREVRSRLESMTVYPQSTVNDGNNEVNG